MPVKKQKRKFSATSRIPTLVKVISVLYYIGAILLAISGILMVFGSSALVGLFSTVPDLAAVGTAIFIVLGIILIVFAVVGFFIGRGLWKRRKWARIVAIILAIIGLVFALLGVVSGQIGSNIISVIVNALIGGHLLFSKKVKSAFA